LTSGLAGLCLHFNEGFDNSADAKKVTFKGDLLVDI
jgi:hypothetical protein